MRKPIHNIPVRLERRTQLQKYMLPHSALILFAHPEYSRNGSVDHPYRQDTNFFYLTGFEEPESIFVFRPGAKPETTLFVRPKDVLRETWDGFRYGPEGAQKEFQVDQAFLVSEFDSKIHDLLKGVSQIYHRWQVDEEIDRHFLEILSGHRQGQGRTGRGHLVVHDANELIGEMRIKKSEYDIAQQRKACQISAEAHRLAMQMTKPGVTERQIHGVLLGSFLIQGASREGYNSIVASGGNATTLHYVFNDQPCKDGDLLLVDAGAEFNYFTGDITRTYPVNGKFSEPQRRVYQNVLDLQKQLISRAKPGVDLKQLQDYTIEFLTQLMIDLGLLQGKREELIQSGAFKKYYPHGVSHWLGMDVHDAGLYVSDEEPRELEPGFVFTIEPGIYIPESDSSAPKELRGIGIRIEDDILVTANGCEVLTAHAPKEIGDLESLIGQGGALKI